MCASLPDAAGIPAANIRGQHSPPTFAGNIRRQHSRATSADNIRRLISLSGQLNL